MTVFNRSLLMRQSLELIFDEAGGGASLKVPTKPSIVRVTPSDAAEYIDSIYTAPGTLSALQVDDHGITLDEAWLWVENMGDDVDNLGQLGIFESDSGTGGQEIGILNAGERFGPIRMGSHWTEVWVRGDVLLSRDVKARVVIIGS